MPLPIHLGKRELLLTNVPGIPSTRVKGASAASMSKPRSSTKKDRTLPAKSALKQVEAHSRMNKSNEKHKNRVDSSISYKRTGNCSPLSVISGDPMKPTGRLLPLGRQCPLVRSTALKSDCLLADPQETITPVAYNLACTNQPDPNYNWGSNVSKYPFLPLFKCRLYRSFSEGLGYNLFSVGQFCDSDLEVAFRKHTCFVRDLDGVDLIKGSRGCGIVD
ncbi:hypothetical protein Tco_1308521 [Tanacetum coccineum]